MGDTLLQMMYRLPKERIVKQEGSPCVANVDVNSAFLGYRDPFDANGACRPYLQISGKCTSISGLMPMGVTELEFDKSSAIRVTYCYEFSDEELADMTLKGLFRPNFKVPDIIYDNILELPAVCDFYAISPEKGELPIVFANITNRHDMVIDSESCGYYFAEYFKEPDSKRVDKTFEDINFANIFTDRTKESTPVYEQDDVAEAVIAEAQKSIEQKELEASFAEIKKRYEERKKLKEKVEAEEEISVETVLDNTSSEDTPKDFDVILERETKRQATRINEYENALDDVNSGNLVYDSDETPRDEALTERISTFKHNGKKLVPKFEAKNTDEGLINFDEPYETVEKNDDEDEFD